MRTSATIRLVVMTVLGLGLLIPLAWIWQIVDERSNRRDAAANEIGATWGGTQYVTGPVIAVPYTVVRTVDSAGHTESDEFNAMFLPEDLRIDGSLRAERRSRGIFDIIVYRAKLRLTGRFAAPDPGDLRGDAIDWSHATLNIGVSDPRGLTQRTIVKLNGHDMPVTGGVADVGLFSAGLHSDLPALDPTSAAPISFDFMLDLNGTRDLRLVPDAQQTDVTLAAAWPHPSFFGRALPDTREVTTTGFTAHWLVQDFARPFPAR